MTGVCSADTVRLELAGLRAELGDPSGDWRPFTVASVPLDLEGANRLPLRLEDRVALVFTSELDYDRDTLDPALEVVTPEDGLVTRFPDLAVTGRALDPHLDTVTVDAVPVSTGADGSFSHAVVLVDGPQVVEVVAIDTVGHLTGVVRSVTLDRDPPAITVLANGVPLATGLMTGQPLTLDILVDDATTTTVTAFLNQEPFVSGTTVSAEGSYRLLVEAVDAALNSSTVERDFRIDRTPPVVSGVHPASGAVTSEPQPTLTGACDDAVTVTVNGDGASVVLGSFVFAGLTLTEGPNAVEVVATDGADNASTTLLTLHLDTEPPSLEVESPDAGALVGEPQVGVEGTVGDPHLDAVVVNGFEASLAGSRFHAVVPLSQEGSVTLAAVATDRAGNSTTATVSVERDTLAPDLQVTLPGPGTTTADPAVTVEGSVSDPHLDALTVNGDGVTPAADGSFVTEVSLPEGRHQVVVTASDTLGHTARVEREVTVDRDAPGFTSPRRGLARCWAPLRSLSPERPPTTTASTGSR